MKNSDAGTAGISRRRAMAALAAWGGASASHAQGWPTRPLRFIVPFPPGGAADRITRALARRMQAGIGFPCIVDNRPGASGTIGAAYVAQAPADGHTLLSHVSSLVIQPHLAPSPYDVLEDLAPVVQTVAGSYVLVTHPSFPADDLGAFVSAVRRAPGRYAYGSFGSGSGPHLAMELLKADAGLFILHIPFRGAAQALQELVAGRIEMAFETSFAAVPHIRAGRLKAIAIGGPRELDVLPGVAPIAWTYPGFDTDGWQGLFAPAGTPAAVIDRIAGQAVAALDDPELVQGITAAGFRPAAGTTAEFASLVRADHARWGRVIRERGIGGEKG